MYKVIQGAICQDDLAAVENGLLAAGHQVSGVSHTDIDEMWMDLSRRDRGLCSLVYNAAKLLPQLHRPVSSMTELIQTACSFEQPVLVDINFRIDAPSEDEYLFGWHQDYWFSICSPSAVVAWVPLRSTDTQIGGVEIFTPAVERVLAARQNLSPSYSDSLVLDEPLPNGVPVAPNVARGDALIFTFDELHRSLPNRSRSHCRWTIQYRWADLADAAFRMEDFKPGMVLPGFSSYVERFLK